MPHVCDMEGVRSYTNGPEPVELWRNKDNGRLVIVTYNEGGECGVEIDLLDLLKWLQSGSGKSVVLDNGEGRTSGGIGVSI
jgi:hypothetical protein